MEFEEVFSWSGVIGATLSFFGLGVMNRIIRRLARSKIDLSVRTFSEGDYLVTRIFIQNQQDFFVPAPLELEIECGISEWYSESDRKAVTVVHGPERNEWKPEIHFSDHSVRIVYNEAMRPLATWLVICKTRNRIPSKLRIELPNDDGFKTESYKISADSTLKRDVVFDFGNYLNRTKVLFFSFPLSVFAFILIGWFLYNDGENVVFEMEDAVYVVIPLLVLLLFVTFALNVTKLVPPSISLGYLEEDNSSSTTYGNPKEKKDSLETSRTSEQAQ